MFYEGSRYTCKSYAEKKIKHEEYLGYYRANLKTLTAEVNGWKHGLELMEMRRSLFYPRQESGCAKIKEGWSELVASCHVAFAVSVLTILPSAGQSTVGRTFISESRTKHRPRWLRHFVRMGERRHERVPTLV